MTQIIQKMYLKLRMEVEGFPHIDVEKSLIGSHFIHNLAKEKMIYLLNKGENVLIFPEGTWNFEPSKPLLPLNWGCVDIAIKTNRPIVPIALDYGQNVCRVKFGDPLHVTESVGQAKGIQKIEEAMATLLWDIWEQQPILRREDVEDDWWEKEWEHRVSAYPKLNVQYEISCARNR